MKLTWCSFADEGRCRGVLILEGHLDPLMASLKARMLNANPGGELLTLEIPEDLEDIGVYIANRNRLLSTEEARRLFDGMTQREYEEQVN